MTPTLRIIFKKVICFDTKHLLACSKLEWQTWCVFVRASLHMRREEKNQLDATEWFIALITCSKYFGHFYAHHQELETICVLLLHMVCSALVAGCRRSGTGQQAMRPERGMLHDVQHPSFWTHSLLSWTWPPTTSNQGTAHHRQ